MESLKGLVAIITGASRGFGRQLSLEIAAEGARVVAAALPQEADALAALADEIGKKGGLAAWRTLDVRDSSQCSALVQWAVQEMGGLQILVNCAGLGHWVSVEQMSDTQWQQMMDVNVSGAFYMSRAALAPMRAAGTGHIVNIASVLGRRGVANFSGYCASKAAVMAFSESLAQEVKRAGIRVTAILPGTADTGFRDQHAGRPLDPSLTDPALMLRPADVASAVVWALKASKHVASMQVVLEPLG